MVMTLTTIRNHALYLIDKLGREVTLRRVSAGAYNPATSSATNTTSDDAGKALLLKYSKDVIDGEVIRTDDRKCVFAATTLAVTPRPSDRIVYSGKQYIIKEVQEVYEAENVIIYICQVRGADSG